MRLDRSRAAEMLGRSLWFVFGVAAVSWAGFVLPIVWRQAPVLSAAKAIIAGDSFKRDVLAQILLKSSEISGSKWRRPSSVADAAIVDVRLLEQAIGDGDQAAIDLRGRELETRIQSALSNEPADPYLWLVLFWLENARKGFRRSNLQYLSISYGVGPNEGWVAVIRNRLAVALFAELTPELQSKATSEFAHLVDSGFVAEAADILTGPGWPVRARLVSSLATVDTVNREQFAKTVYRLGYDISVPGVKPFGFRPWR